VGRCGEGGGRPVLGEKGVGGERGMVNSRYIIVAVGNVVAKR
jgi:hypothetical protein